MVFYTEYLFKYLRNFSKHIQRDTSLLLPLSLIRIVSYMLGFVGSGFVKSLKVFQVSAAVAAEVLKMHKKFSEKRKKQLARDRALAEEKYELPGSKENIA